MINKMIGTLLFGRHVSSDFYARLTQRSPPEVGETAATLRSRIATNLERDQFGRWLALRIFAFFLIAQFLVAPGNAVVSWAGELLQKKAFDRDLQRAQELSQSATEKRARLEELETRLDAQANGEFK